MTNSYNPSVSLFVNVWDKKPRIVGLSEILCGMSKLPKVRDVCSSLRDESALVDKPIRRKIELPAITVSGVFSEGHKRSNLIQASGVIQLDFDEKDNPGRELVEIGKKNLKEDPYTYAGFVSPSGKGFKVLVKISQNPALHDSHFRELDLYYMKTYNLKADRSCKDICRLCYLSWDDDLFLNGCSKTFLTTKRERIYHNIPSSDIIRNSINVEVEGVIIQAERLNIDLTYSYTHWLKLAFALSSSFGESGREYFHRLSRISIKYDFDRVEKLYNICLKRNSTEITIKTLFLIAKEFAIDISPSQLKRICSNGK